jgi:hypothetical protein
MGDRGRTDLMARSRDISSSIGVFIVVLLALQIFLLSIGLDALHSHNSSLAWTSAILSLLLAAGSAAFYRYLR